MRNLIDFLAHDPRAINVGIMAIYATAATRWAFAGRWADVWYWVSALSITACVTFGYRR